MAYATIYLSTADDEFSQELNDVKLEGVEVLTRLTAAVQWDKVTEHIIEFTSDASIALFLSWLRDKVASKKKPRKTRINGSNVPAYKTELVRLIKKLEKDLEQCVDDDQDEEKDDHLFS
jgi:hypothetical protein